jgi:hypothetical protein
LFARSLALSIALRPSWRTFSGERKRRKCCDKSASSDKGSAPLSSGRKPQTTRKYQRDEMRDAWIVASGARAKTVPNLKCTVVERNEKHQCNSNFRILIHSVHDYSVEQCFA